MRLGIVLVLAVLCRPASVFAHEEPPEGLQHYLFDLCVKLQGAALSNDLEELEAQIDFGADLECRMRDAFDAATPIILAASDGNAEAVAFLVENGANVNARDRKGWTALRHARLGLENSGEGSDRSVTFARTIEILERAKATE